MHDLGIPSLVHPKEMHVLPGSISPSVKPTSINPAPVSCLNRFVKKRGVKIDGGLRLG